MLNKKLNNLFKSIAGAALLTLSLHTVCSAQIAEINTIDMDTIDNTTTTTIEFIAEDSNTYTYTNLLSTQYNVLVDIDESNHITLIDNVLIGMVTSSIEQDNNTYITTLYCNNNECYNIITDIQLDYSSFLWLQMDSLEDTKQSKILNTYYITHTSYNIDIMNDLINQYNSLN